jgi:hypothetical protein
MQRSRSSITIFSIILNQKWAIQSLAAMKIQQVYRNWKIWRTYYLIKINRNIRSRHTFVRTLQPLNSCFESVISRNASPEQKMVVWRSVIDLRRLNSKLSVDIIIKALIEAEGEFNRANILLGSKDFRCKNAAELPLIVRNLFLPLACRPILNVTSSATTGRRSTENMKGTTSSSSSSGRMKFLKALREQQRMIKRDDLVNAVDQIVSSSYFSSFPNHSF